MIPWQVYFIILGFFIPLIIILIWTFMPLGSAEEFQRKRWNKKWRKNFPELYEEEEK